MTHQDGPATRDKPAAEEITAAILAVRKTEVDEVAAKRQKRFRLLLPVRLLLRQPLVVDPVPIGLFHASRRGRRAAHPSNGCHGSILGSG